MKVLFVWTGVTSYMADCWRRLQSVEGVELKVVVDNVCSGRAFDAGRVLGGLDFAIVDGVENGVSPDGFLAGWRPDIVFAVGWRSPVVRRLVTRKDWRDVPKVCCFDMPWRWSARCIAARWILRPFLRNYSAAYVPGRQCARYALWLGFPRIETGLFSIDMEKLRRERGKWNRRGFLYVGRYSREKRLDIVEKAHRIYLDLGGSWELDCYGQGGKFAQPEEMPRIYAQHACLLLASAFDPWPLVALEARAAGCDVIMSDRCGNRHELAGVAVVRYGDAASMAEHMLRVEMEWRKNQSKWRLQGEREPPGRLDDIEMYDCGEWVGRTLRLAAELTDGTEAK